MIYLSENEVGFDATSLGFPSIRGCQAVVYVTDRGLFGLHNFGGGDNNSFPLRAGIFRSFVTNHAQSGGVGSALYGVCFPMTERGYSEVKRVNWLGELKEFASKVGFGGPIYGYDLNNRIAIPPAYVRFEKTGGACVIQVKPWAEGDKTTGPNASPANYQAFGRANTSSPYTLRATKTNVVTNVTDAGLSTVYPEKLR